MADNIVIPTQGSGDSTPTVAAEDVFGVKYQRIKIVEGTAAGTEGIPGSAALGLKTYESRPASTVAVVDLLSATDATRVLTILAANTSRRGATIFNNTDTSLLIREGGNASPTSYTDILPAGARYILDYPVSTSIITAYLPQVPAGRLLTTERS